MWDHWPPTMYARIHSLYLKASRIDILLKTNIHIAKTPQNCINKGEKTFALVSDSFEVTGVSELNEQTATSCESNWNSQERIT